MRKVFAGLFSSLDGVVGGPNEWQPSFDAEMGAALSRMLDEQDAAPWSDRLITLAGDLAGPAAPMSAWSAQRARIE